ncbi:MAG: acetolactate synthase large subunit [Thermosediminibacterales bacterium]|nr:acetolactate synthase large subunit [Thermosediminibacterales bacterium]MDK2835246.1 acetolactate synthase large subunit [Thermosediminibacterales bacterium]
MNGAQALIKSLENEGVKVVFGYPGGAVLSLYEALKASNINHILTRSEQAAAHAASGYSRVTGKPGVCLATSGPGATNLITGIATAYMDSIPIIAITGQVSTEMIGKDVFQEVDITGATAPFTKHNYLVKNVKDIPRIVKEAFHIASTGRPGPVLIDIPKDVAAQELEFYYPKTVELKGYKPNYNGHPLQINRAVEAIKRAERPIICSGGGVISGNASSEVIKLAETCQIPVVTTLMGIGGFPGNHELFLGLVGVHGSYRANKAISSADLIIAVGARFADRVTGGSSDFAKKAEVIHIDIDPAEIGKNVEPTIPIVGDVKNVLKDILKGVDKQTRPQWIEAVNKFNSNGFKDKNNEYVKPRDVIKKLYQLTCGKAIVSTEVGQHQLWTAHYYTFSKPRTFLTSGGLGTMGYGFPAAIGAQVAKPEATVINISGDGSFQMNLSELATAMENQLPVKVLIFNNRCLGMVRQLQEFYCNRNYYGVSFKNIPDFVKVAEGFGAKGFRITKDTEIEPVLKKVIDSKYPCVVDIIIAPEENVYPMVLNGSPISEMIGG